MRIAVRFLLPRSRCQRGFTLMEIMAGSLIASVVAGGTFMALATAARLSAKQSSPAVGEAMGFAKETIERPRNHVAADAPDLTWFTSRALVWQDDALPAFFGSESINQPGLPAERRYCVVSDDCDGDTIRGDCFRVEVRVCWNGEACPLVGAPCP